MKPSITIIGAGRQSHGSQTHLVFVARIQIVIRQSMKKSSEHLVAFFAEMPDVWTMAGAALIVASTIYIARREAKAASP